MTEGGLIGLVLVLFGAAVGVAWLLLPFLLLDKLNAQRKATEAAAARADALARQVAENTRQTAEACAALTQWAERMQDK